MTRDGILVTRLFAFTCLSLAGLLLIAARPALAQSDCKPAAPLPQSKCNKDAQCCAGLVCGPAGSSQNNAMAQCQPGCLTALGKPPLTCPKRNTTACSFCSTLNAPL